VLLDTDDRIKGMIKKFIKKKAEVLPNVLFLYYVVRNEDFGKNGLLEKDKTKYPKMCHMYGMTELLIGVTSIDNVQIMEQSFKHKEKGIELEKWYSHVPQQDNCTEEIISDDDNQKDEHISEKQNTNDIQKNVCNNSNSSNSYIQPVQQTYQTIDPVVEKKKFLQKLLLLKTKSDEYNVTFLKEFQKRKKEEEKNNKKNKD
jgi:hypothetical protein